MTIFVSGVHGVGKSFLCENFASKNSRVVHASASSLIKKGRTSLNWSVDKKVGNADENQLILAREVEKIIEAGNELLLDGHTILINDKNGYIHLEPEVFRSLKIAAIILIQADTEKITQRIEARDSLKTTLEIDEFMRLERDQVNKISKALGIPYVTLDDPSLEKFSLTVNSFLKF